MTMTISNFGFWFGSDLDESADTKDKTALWWSKNPDVDSEIQQRFEYSMIRAAVGVARNDDLSSLQTLVLDTTKV